MDVAIVIPVFNQVNYTKGCLDSLRAAEVSASQIVIVDNGSTDETGALLAGWPDIHVIRNRTNLGCGAAWTQGARCSTSTWTGVMNNDVLVPPGCLEGLIEFAEKEQFDIVSPAMREGDLDYEFSTHSARFMRRMRGVSRWGVAHGVCFMVHRRVFETIGYFDDDPKLGGYEDDEYFRRARSAGFRSAITGQAFLHHFGSITQKSIKADRQNRAGNIGDRAYYRRKTGQTWPRRKATQLRNNLRNAWWRHSERLRYGLTLREQRVGGVTKYL